MKEPFTWAQIPVFGLCSINRDSFTFSKNRHVHVHMLQAYSRLAWVVNTGHHKRVDKRLADTSNDCYPTVYVNLWIFTAACIT